jgi:hypothetical protein
MSQTIRFDPFNSRLCRNVRNALCEGFKSALSVKELQPVKRVAGFFREEPQPAHVRTYIDDRLEAYEKVLTEVIDLRLEHPLDIAMKIWDCRLFFETHEYLETFWLGAKGEEKALLQALIRAAGTYVHLEQGNQTGAKRISSKAIPVLKEKRSLLDGHADAELLLTKLNALDPEPPRLSLKAD